MKTGLIFGKLNWKSRLCVFLYVTALLLMIKLILGVAGTNVFSQNKENKEKTEITETIDIKK